MLCVAGWYKRLYGQFYFWPECYSDALQSAQEVRWRGLEEENTACHKQHAVFNRELTQWLHRAGTHSRRLIMPTLTQKRS